MNKTLIGSIVAVALGGIVLTGCTSNSSGNDTASEPTVTHTAAPAVEKTVSDTQWEAGIRVGVRHGFTSGGEDTTAQACEGFSMMGVTDADGVVDLLNEMAGEMGQTTEQFLEVSSADLPEGVTMNEALAVAGDEIVQICAL